MSTKRATGIKKKSVAAKKAISGKRATRVKKNHLPATAIPASAAPVPAASLTMSASASGVSSMSTPASAVPSAMSTPASAAASAMSAPAPAAASAMPAPTSDAQPTVPAPAAGTNDLSATANPISAGQDAGVAALHAELAAVTQQLNVAQEALAGAANETPIQMQEPNGVRNLQEAMGLMDNPGQYQLFRFHIKRYAIAAGLDYKLPWARQDRAKITRVGVMARNKHIFLRRYVNDWPIKIYLQRRFANQRSYEKRCDKAAAAAIANMGDIWDFGSNASATSNN